MNQSTKQNAFVKVVAFFAALFWVYLTLPSVAATFTGTADLTVSDSSGALSVSWNPSGAALNIQCWFKISIPSGTNLTQNMVILANGTSGFESQFTGLVVVVEVCTNLANPVWTAVATNTLTGGVSYFSDAQWTSYRGRFYRLRSP